MELLNQLIKRSFLLLFPFFLFAGELSFYNPFLKETVVFKSTAYSDFASIYDLLKGWKTLYNKKNKNIAYYDTSIEIKTSFKNYNIGYLRKDEYFINSNFDTTLFIYQLINKDDFTENKKYKLNLYLKGFSSDALFISKVTTYNNLKIGITCSAVKVRGFQNGWIKGEAISSSDGSYDYNAESNYYYNHNYLYKYNVNKARGYGYTTHLGISYKINKFNFLLLINDLFSRIYFDKAPYSHIYITSSNTTYDNGYIVYNPTIYGIEKYKKYHFSLMRKLKIELDYKNYFIANDNFMHYNYPYIGYIRKNYKISYGFKFRDVQLNYQSNKFLFSIGCNNINLKKASYIKLNIGYNFKF